MLELIYKYGEFFKQFETDLSFMKLLQPKYETIRYYLEIDISENKKVTSVWKDGFNPDIVNKACFFQSANFFMGAGCLVYAKNNEEEKIKTKIKNSLAFIECDTSTLDEIYKIIDENVTAYNVDFFVILTKERKTPYELYSPKAEELISNSYYKPHGKKSLTCHLCGKNKILYEKIGYTFFTNDKENYGCTETFPFLICDECLKKILLAKLKIEDYFTGFWCGSRVMVLPHVINDEIVDSFRFYRISDAEADQKLLDRFRENEEDILEFLSNEVFKAVDFIFYNENNSETKINYHIHDALPSQFSKLSKAIKANDLKLKDVFFCFCNTPKERMRIIDILLKSKDYAETIFYTRLLNSYLKSFRGGYTSYTKTLNIYNLFISQECIKGGKINMKSYQNYNDLFNDHPDRFCSNIEKAWFLLGKLYNSLVYYSKDYHDSSESSYQKTLMLNASFDEKFFLKTASLCEQKIMVYGKLNSFVKNMIADLSSFFSLKERAIESYEAKFLFFWGYNQYFETSKIEGKETVNE